MEHRGRKSTASLAVVSELTDRRQTPPDVLTEAEKELWRAVVATKPGDWWDAGTVPHLVEYCRTKTSLELVSAEFTGFDSEWLKTDDGLKRYHRLINVRDKLQGRITNLAMKMRLTQQSRYSEKTANTAANRAAPQRLWERS